MKFSQRPSLRRLELLHRTLPYGRYHALDGREILYNRRYEPTWQRWPGQPATAADPAEWIEHEMEEWFFDDTDPPWRNRATFELCHRILEDFQAGRPIPHGRNIWRGAARARPDYHLAGWRP